MAPLKQPGTLQSLAQVRLANLTMDACRKHEETIVSYDTSQRVKIVEEIQEFIGALPVILLNEVCQVINRRLLSRPNCGKKNNTFAYAVVMHKDVNQITIGRDLSLHTHETESFWKDRFRSMSKLSEVNFEHSFALSFVSTITESCPNLKKITFSSPRATPAISLSDASAAIPVLTRHRKFRYDVCEGVRAVKCGDSIQHLLESLPGLEVCIVPRNVSLGDILISMRNNGSMQLQLSYFEEDHATPTHIDSMIALCPQVTHLKLRPRSAAASDGIMDILKNRSLKIQTLEFVFSIPITQSRFESLLESKGSYLKSLDLDFEDEDLVIHFDVVRSIGECCPHLEKLKIQVHMISSALDLPDNSRPIAVPPEGRRPFQKLTTLDFGVVFYQISSSVQRSVSFCLENSVHLKSLQLWNVFQANFTFEEFVKIFASGRLQELKYLKLSCYQGPLFTKQIAQYLYESFKQLTCVQFDSPSVLSENALKYLIELDEEVKRNNIDFVVKFVYGFD